MDVRKQQHALKLTIIGVRELGQWCGGGLPGVTLILSAAAILIQVHADFGASLSFDRRAIGVGEHWRFFTGHLTHWNADHLAWDVFMFALLGAMIERRSRRCLGATLFASATAISAATWITRPDIEHYRGLSGIDSALFTLALLILFEDTRRAKQPIAGWALIAMATGFIGKILWELAAGSTLFVDSYAAGFTALPLVHAVGGVTGVLTWCGRRIWNTHVRAAIAGKQATSRSPVFNN